MGIKITPVSPADQSEIAVARRLQSLIEQAWPDLRSEDHIRILVGLRAGYEIDLVVEVNLAIGRQCDVDENIHFFQAALIVVEIKQLDPSRLTCVGTQIFADYKDGEHRNRSVNSQLADQIMGLRTWRSRYGGAPFFIHGMAWLTECPHGELDGVESNIFGAEATWLDMLAGLGRQNPILFGPKPPRECESIRQITDILARPRAVIPRDWRRVDVLTNAVLNSGAIANAKEALGKKQLCLMGRAGSGKSTALALLADHATRVLGERVLVLTYHRALCNELEALVVAIAGTQPVLEKQISIQPVTDFIASAFDLACRPAPRAGKNVDYQTFSALLSLFVAKGDELDGLRSQVGAMKALDPAAFEFDHIFIDEAQDILDSERDFLRALYPTSSFVLADGLDQLVRRGQRCNWNADVPKGKRATMELGRSLRMSSHIAAFINEVAVASGLQNWRIEGHPEHHGGRIILRTKPIEDDREFFDSMAASAEASYASTEDLLVVVGHKLVHKETRQSIVAKNLRKWGYHVWDGANPAEREHPPETADCIRIVQYDSVRGLEGWGAILLGLDDFFGHRMKYPNVPCSTDDERLAIARQWLLMSLSRAAHTLVISLRDPESQTGQWMRQAAHQMPKDVVEIDL